MGIAQSPASDQGLSRKSVRLPASSFSLMLQQIRIAYLAHLFWVLGKQVTSPRRQHRARRVGELTLRIYHGFWASKYRDPRGHRVCRLGVRTLRICSGFWASKYSVQVSTEPVVSCPATSIDSKSSRSWLAETSSLEAIKKRRMLGSPSLM